jgi:hypothetical protein
VLENSLSRSGNVIFQMETEGLDPDPIESVPIHFRVTLICYITSAVERALLNDPIIMSAELEAVLLGPYVTMCQILKHWMYCVFGSFSAFSQLDPTPTQYSTCFVGPKPFPSLPAFTFSSSCCKKHKQAVLARSSMIRKLTARELGQGLERVWAYFFKKRTRLSVCIRAHKDASTRCYTDTL